MPKPRFTDKQIRQIEHLLKREEGEGCYWDLENTCTSDCCANLEMQFYLDKPSENTIEKLHTLIDKYGISADVVEEDITIRIVAI